MLADEIGMDAVQIADTELIGVQRESDTAISITVKGGAADKNEAAARLNRKILTLSAAALGVKEEVRASLDFEQARSLSILIMRRLKMKNCCSLFC